MTQAQILIHLLIPTAIAVGIAFASLDPLGPLPLTGPAQWAVGALIAFSAIATYLVLRVITSRN
jgi:hypothetical protein